MITQAPLPDWNILFNAMWRKPLSESDLVAPWHRENETAGWLSRSLWSLALIALWRRRLVPTTQPTAWIPDFFCNSSLQALRITGFKLVFYPLTAQMEPDMVACRELSKTTPPDIFLLVHYFGRPVEASHASDFCRHFGSWLIEDAAHVLRPLAEVGATGDFVIYSPHKHLPVPDGSVLVVRPKGPSILTSLSIISLGSPSTWTNQLDELLEKTSISAIRSQALARTWLLKRVLQKLGVRRLSRSAPFRESDELQAFNTQNLIAPSLSGVAYRLLSSLISDLGRVARNRQRNQLFLDALLAEDKGIHYKPLLPAERSEGRLWTPYLGAYQFDSISNAEAGYNLLQERGFQVATWPDLPPEVKQHKLRHANAWNLRHTRIYIPVHQSLHLAGMLKTKPKPAYAQTFDSEALIQIIWDDASPEQWNYWMMKAGRSNLLQSWEWGESKSADSVWKVKRGVFFRNADAIAIVQILQISVVGILKISRISRGPLFLEPPSSKVFKEVWQELSTLGNIFQCKVLTVAPESYLTGPHLLMMGYLGFRQFSPNAWESVWLDLRLESTELRKRLNGKWRNALFKGEKYGLGLEVGTDDMLFGWMLKKYKKQMLEKNYGGVPINMLISLRKNLPKESQLLILRAMFEGEAVGGICLARHGAAATYLVGWNGISGRQLKANQYLLWNAIIILKQFGIEWFDLGGVNEDDMPGISEFKLGLNGKPYETIGEYWKW